MSPWIIVLWQNWSNDYDSTCVSCFLLKRYWVYKNNLWLLHLFLFRTKTAIPVRSVQNADCWLQTGYKMQTGHKMQTADCRLGKKMQTENLFCFFVWYLIICHPTTYRASRNRAFPRSSFTIICTIVRLPALVWNIPCPFLDHNRS